MLRYVNGARGLIWSSPVSPGNENALRVRVCGSKGGLEFHQVNPNQLGFTPLGQARRVITRGGSASGAAASRAARIPAGHPEGYLEAFAQIYKDFTEQLHARLQGRVADPQGCRLPGAGCRVPGARGVLPSSTLAEPS